MTKPTKCEFCGKEVEKPVTRKLWYRVRELRRGRFGRMEDKTVVKARFGSFCSPECATKCQMGLEG